MERFLERLQGQFGTGLGISRKARNLLTTYPWPGNIAELESVLELAAFNAEGRTIDVGHLAESLSGGRTAARLSGPVATLQEMERKSIEDALQASQGNMSKASRMLGISRNTLYRKLREIGIRSEDEACEGPAPRGKNTRKA
jgi:transcriptional regulator of acetoin/glycerol metabolism